MVKRIAALVFIYLCTVVAWMILGATVEVRTNLQDTKLRRAVGQLWGTVQRQSAPTVHYETFRETKVEKTRGAETILETRREAVRHNVPLEGSDIDVKIHSEPRRKGLLWYSTYQVSYTGRYRIANHSKESRTLNVEFSFPSQGAVYDDFHFLVGGREIGNVKSVDGRLVRGVKLEPGGEQTVTVSYVSQGMDEWWYQFGTDVTQVKNFTLNMETDFDGFDFPESGISPTRKERRGSGWDLGWSYVNLLSGVQLGLAMPEKINPGPWVSRVTFAAPISLFLFFFLLFIITTRKEVRIHPMNYFFLGAAFFAFHLLLAYLADHISVQWALMISSAVSIVLVVSYMRIVTGSRFAFLEVGLSQFVYLVLFSCTFFLQGFTGLAITVLCIVTLFIVMQYTAHVDWEKVFQRK